MPRGRFSPLSKITSMVDHPQIQPEPNSGCWLWTGNTTHRGYGLLRRPSGAGFAVAHRVSWEMAGKPPVPAGLVLRHKCNTPRCTNPDHLCLGTQQDNMDDAKRAGSFEGHSQGEKHPMVKLTEQQVLMVLKDCGRTARIEWANKLNVSRYCIDDIMRRRSWRHLDA